MTEFKESISSTLCQQFGLNKEQRLQRLRLLDLSDDEKVIAEILIKNVIEPNITEIVNEFYAKLMEDPTAREFISDIELLNRLKKTQSKYLLNLGVNFNTQTYFESRLRAGLAHAWVGLPLVTYQCGYYIQQKIIVHYIKSMVDKHKIDVLTNFLLKIIALDMSLAIESYHGLQIQGLSQSLDKMQDRHRQLQEKSSKDSLTGVLTRGQILENLDQCIKKAKEKSQQLSIIMVDIDNFKKINDKFGHQAGDYVLRQMANRFKSAIRSIDNIGRIGGEEFLIILPNAELDIAINIAERIRTHVSTTPVKSEDILLNVSVSEGVTEFVGGDTAKTLIAKADKALYEAKNNGRNRVVYLDAKTTV